MTLDRLAQLTAARDAGTAVQLTFAPTAAAGPATANRDATTGADTGTFTGIAVPWDDQIDLYGDGYWLEEVARGAVQDSADAKVYWRHGEIIGHVTAGRDAEAGWEIDGLIADTRTGRDAYALLKAGSLDKLSIGFIPLEWTRREDGSIVYTKIRVLEVSLVPHPAYAAATITEVRSTPTTKGTPLDNDTTHPDATVENMRATIEDMERRMAAMPATAPAAPAARGSAWASHGELLRDIAAGVPAALEFHRDYTGGTTDDSAPNAAWIGERIVWAAERRRVLNSFTTEVLPATGMSVEYAKLKSNTLTAKEQAKQGDDLTMGKIAIELDHANVKTRGGATSLSLQTIQRSSVNILNMSLNALTLAYLQATEQVTRDVLKAGITEQLVKPENHLTLPASATWKDWISLIVDGYEMADERGYALAGTYVSKDYFKELATMEDSSGRSIMNIQGAGVNQVGTVDVPALEGKMGPLTFKLLPGAANKTASFFDPVAISTQESPGAPIQLQAENVVNLTKDFSVHGNLVSFVQHPGALIPIKAGA